LEVLDGYGERFVRVIKGELLEFQYEDDKENALIPFVQKKWLQ